MPNESQERADRLDANVSLFALDKYASDTRPADIEFREVHELCKEIERLTHENARLQSIVTLRERATDEPAAPLDLRRYFKVSPVAVQGEPDACRLDFHVGVQTIPIGPEYCETAEHAEWWINVICKALQNVISAASRPAEPPSAWQPIETAPHDREVLFWVVPLSADETYRDTSGNPITSGEKPRMMFCRFGRWSSLSKAIYWADVPGSPTVTKSEEPEPEHVCDGGWACHFHDVKKAAAETSAAAELRASPPPTDALTLEQLTAAIAYMGCDTDREYTPEAFARDLFAAARQSSTKSAQSNTEGEVGRRADVGPGGGAIAQSDGATRAPELSVETDDRQWLIRKRGYYYRPDRAGYTSNVADAGRYTEAEAKAEAAIEPSIMQAIHISQAMSEDEVRK